MFSAIDITALMLLLVGILIRYQIGKRRFKRTNVAGLQLFPNYGTALLTRFFERLINFIGLLMIVTALFLILKRFLRKSAFTGLK
jgi:hypothetical protein